MFSEPAHGKAHLGMMCLTVTWVSYVRVPFWVSTQGISYCVIIPFDVNNFWAEFFQEYSPTHSPLGGGRGVFFFKILVVSVYFDFMTQQDPSKLFKCFHYTQQFLFSHCVVLLSLIQLSAIESERSTLLRNHRAQLIV